MGVNYRGDIDADGLVHMPRIDVVNGVHGATVDFLRRETGATISSQFGSGIGALFRGMAVDEIPEPLMLGVRVGVGMNKLNMKAAEQEGMATLSTPGGSTEAVARRAHTFALAWASDIIQQTVGLRGHNWSKKGGQPLDRMTTGVVGFGRIGQAFAERMCRDTKNILVFDPYMDWDELTVSDAVHRKMEVVDDLGELAERAHIVSAHVGGDTTILTPDILERLSPDGLLINTGRAANIDKPALRRQMEKGLNVGLDVFWNEGEDMFTDEDIAAIVGSPNFMGTSHTAASDDETQRILGLEGARAMADFITQGVINRHDIPGHTVPAVVPSTKKQPGVRAAMLHKSVAGVLATITRAVADKDLQITGFWNSEDEADAPDSAGNGNGNLAYTVANIQTVDIPTAVEIMNRITEETEVLKHRLMYYT